MCNYLPALISSVQFQQDPANLDARVEYFLKMFESTLYQMSDAEFKVRCASLSMDLLFDLALFIHVSIYVMAPVVCLRGDFRTFRINA